MDHVGQVVGTWDPGAGINKRNKSNQNDGAGMEQRGMEEVGVHNGWKHQGA